MIRSFFEFLFLTLWVAPKVFWFSFLEERKVKRRFYKNEVFKDLDLFFHKLYRFKNPYKISKKYKQEKGDLLFHAYGETPLTVFHEMFEKASIEASDCFVDLGCGRGRGVFFASSVWGCKSIGVEEIPFFSEQGKKLSSLEKKAKIFLQNIQSFDLALGTFFYFYGLCLKEEELNAIVLHLESMSPGSKLVTVSFPLTEYSSSFDLLSSWESTYPWGETDLFLHVKKG